MQPSATTKRFLAFSWKKVVFVVVGLLLLVGAWFIGYQQGSHPAVSTTSHAIRLGGYEYINPLILTDNRASDRSPEMALLQMQLQQYVDKKKADRSVERMSIIVRDLNSGHWTGVNEDDTYAPASLLKVPVLMAYLYEGQEKPEMLNANYVNDAKDDPDSIEFYKPSVSLTVGQSYPVVDLMADMIIYSSNAALQTLITHMDNKSLDELYALLGFDSQNQDETSDYLSPRQYSLLFRILYNGTYIGPDFSEKVLELLAHVEFKDGLVKGLPDGTVAAHKFGERGVAEGDDPLTTNKRELHDCGIVYAPGHPYLFCAMTQGTSFPDLADAIAGASTIAYNASKNF